MAKGFLDGCIWQAQSEGLGDFAFTEALESFFSPTEAGAVDGTTYNYTAYKGASREAGRGVWNESTGTLTRNPVISTNSNGLVNFADPPVVIMGGPLAQDMRVDLITVLDLSSSGPHDLPLDDNTYASYQVVIRDALPDISGGTSGDYIRATFDVLDGSNVSLLSELSEWNILSLADYDGANWNGYVSSPLTAEIITSPYAVKLTWRNIGLITLDNSITSFSDMNAGEFNNLTFDSPPATAAKLRLVNLFWDAGEADYGANRDFVSGSVHFYGLRK